MELVEDRKSQFTLHLQANPYTPKLERSSDTIIQSFSAYLLTAAQMFPPKPLQQLYSLASSMVDSELPKSQSWKTSGSRKIQKTTVTHQHDQLPSTKIQSSLPTGQCWRSHRYILLHGRQQGDGTSTCRTLVITHYSHSRNYWNTTRTCSFFTGWIRKSSTSKLFSNQ